MIKVLHPEFLNTVQDKCRVGFAEFGVPKSDVMDLYEADFANLILNNSLNDALLEISFGGCILQFLENTTICISGADFLPELNQMNVTLHKKVEVQKNDILSSGKRSFDAYSYLVVKGGFQKEVKLQSRSFFNISHNNMILKKEIYCRFCP